LDFHNTTLPHKVKNLLDLVFANFSDVAVSNSYIDLVEPDTFHPSIAIDLSIFLPPYAQSLRSFHNYASGDYSLLYTLLSSYDWSRVYRESSVDSAVTQLSAAVSEAMDLAVPYKCIRKS
jgi:hypothetical protein